MKLKLLVDIKAKKVVYAEADNNVKDILICLRLSFPLGTIVNPLKEISMVGSIGSLYKSTQNLLDAYRQPYHSEKSGGFVKELVTYMVMDNLEIRLMSTKDFVTLFNNLRAKKEVTELGEMVVDFGKDEEFVSHRHHYPSTHHASPSDRPLAVKSPLIGQ
ncbi:hypothetical protein Ddye_028573 [Dipteronia dyeriana]|uniref:Uncharacterized protein n=1 Tax=Dipteronia dyeriana TaxID=168575 RepID=A0AAD9WJT3_9ROSI|nr:hypothetical protein Ddye_028573 [Dipteronia dyeriana]